MEWCTKRENPKINDSTIHKEMGDATVTQKRSRTDLRQSAGRREGGCVVIVPNGRTWSL
jgi:hypothetical protein